MDGTTDPQPGAPAAEPHFYVAEHNGRIPHSAFRGQTPDEMYFGKGDAVPDQLAAARTAARVERLAVDRARECAVCA